MKPAASLDSRLSLRERTRVCRTDLQTRLRKLTGLETRPTFAQSLSAIERVLFGAECAYFLGAKDDYPAPAAHKQWLAIAITACDLFRRQTTAVTIQMCVPHRVVRENSSLGFR